ncbi:MAG TPA: BTAD domain-containing putative transcriptional regulator [Thermoleophilaceae bacterium]
MGLTVVVSPSGTASRLRIRLCGGLAVEHDGERLDARLPSRQARIVFARLVDQRGHAISRASLADALWGDSPPPSRDVALRAVLSGARRVLGSESLAGRGELRLVLPDDVWIDVEAATRHLRSAEQAMEEGRSELARREAAAAAEILQDEFLPGCGGPWAEERRLELEELHRQARELEARAALANRDTAAAERIARRLVERAPYRESAHALLMEALTAQGNVAEALLAYDRLVRILRDDLGTTPAPAVAALHERLLVDGEGATRDLRPRRRWLGPRLAGVVLACAGIALFAIELAAGDAAEPVPVSAPVRALPTQQAVLPGLRIAFEYPKSWPLRRPASGLTGIGGGDSFCNIFRAPDAAPGQGGMVRYARRRLRAWSRGTSAVEIGPVHAVGGRGTRGATAVEHDRAFGAAEAGRVIFFAARGDVLRIECSAPVHAFGRLDRAAFIPLAHSFRVLDG